MRTLDDLEFNELPIVARENGRVSLWGAWKRRVAAFHDPALWQGAGAFERYFDRLTDGRWGVAGYGVIVVDFDAREVLSFTDWSTPASLHPMNANVDFSGQENPDMAPLQALARCPEEWANVVLTITPLHAHRPETVSLARALGPSACARAQSEPDESQRLFFAAMTAHRGSVSLGAYGRRLVLEGRYLPSGWTQHDDRGQDVPEWLLGRLVALRDRGFPAPHWDGFDETFERHDVPTTDAAFNALARDAEDGDDEQAVAAMQLAQAYRDLKAGWPEATGAHPSPAS